MRSARLLGVGAWPFGAGAWPLGAGAWPLGVGAWLLGAGAWLGGCARGDAAIFAASPVAARRDTGADASGKFSGEAAFAELQRLMALPRSLGDRRRKSSIDALARRLVEMGAQLETVEHVAHDPVTEVPHRLVEIVGHWRVDAPRRFVLATHFDTRPWAEMDPDPARRGDPVPGANDGTSGLAVILVLVPLLLEQLPDDVGITVALFDGEELGHPPRNGYCMGSREVARRIAAGELPLLARAEFGIVLDMVGDRDLRIPIEKGSLSMNAELVDLVWGTAAEHGYDAFVPEVGATGILDDHTFLGEAGIPSILIIDREYAPWHTTRDTVEHVSPASLEIVGEVLRSALSARYGGG